jgi:hypothetical protein
MGLIQKAFSDIITFSRASNATRIGPTGRVEYAPHNLLTYSEQFDNAAWITARASVVANAVAAPNGTVTADKLVEDTTASNNHRIRQDISTSAIPYTFTVFCKAAERGYVALYNLTTLSGQVFDLITGTVGVVVGTAPTSASITSAGNGWYRCSITVTATAATNSWSLYILPSNTSTLTYTGDGTSGIYVWGAQLSVGSVPGDYTPTTSAAVYGPRFDFDPVTLAARGLLIEEQRTNLLTYSEQFNNAAWTADNVIKTADTTTSPDGTVNADSITESATTANHRIYQVLSKAASAITYTASVYAKTNGRNMRLHFDGGTVGNSVSAGFNLSAGTISVAATATGTFSGASATITPVGNGWYQCTVTGTTGTETTVRPNIFVLNGTTDYYAGDGTSGIYVWGAQLEAGSFATSYIPTLASTVTRSADVATVNTLSPWFNATEGTLFAEFNASTGVSYCAPTSLYTDANNEITIVGGTAGAGAAGFVVVAGGSVQANPGTRALSRKIAGAYKLNDFAVSTNGAAAATDTSGTVPSISTLGLGSSYSSSYLNGHLRRVAYYPRRLANAELQALTA